MINGRGKVMMSLLVAMSPKIRDKRGTLVRSAKRDRPCDPGAQHRPSSSEASTWSQTS